ncbi:MAG TPA: glycoside hydrolase family 2 TIM barrel-domain containing protein [Ignavibacteriaceae bacterium]|nr:glycoside hydrolase family 2 TIM barrel-domain containing protein [Ignavibacteriaceae bacterium]
MKTGFFRFLFLLSAFFASDISAQVRESSTIVLRNNWSIQSSAELTDNGKVISQSGYSTKDWYPTSVPSTVLAALVANGVYPDPYYGNNYLELPGIRRWDIPEGNPFETSWWYRTEFDIPLSYTGKHIWLKFHSINYRANLWVNGQQVADSSQMEGAYRLYSFDISQFAKAGQKNCLALEIYPPKTFDLTISWVDWNPTPPDRGMGIWYDVILYASGPVAIDHPFVKTKLNLPSTDQAGLTVIAEVKNAEMAPLKGLLKGKIENITFSKEVNLNANETKEIKFSPEEFPQLVVSNPRLWWPHTVGPQNLYSLDLSFEIDGKISDTRKLRFGIREISSWMNEFDSLRTKVFQVNGKNIVIRGGGYVEDLMLRPSNERIDIDLSYLKFMNLNALRMEAPRGSDYLFERCDEEGILVMVGWCCGVAFESWKNWTPHTADIAEKSWQDQIINLRAHPSVFTWLYGSDNFPPEDVERRYINILKQYDGTRPYSSSATQAASKIDGYTGLFMGPWPQVYGYFPPSYWYTKLEFNTECGPNGEQLPPIETIKRVMPEKDLWPISPMWDLRQRKHFYPFSRKALEARYGKPVTLEEYCSKSQILQLEAVKAMFEAFAGNKYKSSGVIYWMYNSAWPKFYWQLYDYFFMPNGAFYGAKKACEPLHVQYNYKENVVQLVNCFYKDFSGLKVTAGIFDFTARQIYSKEITANVNADESKILFRLDVPKELKNIYFLKLNVKDEAGKDVSSNFYWLSANGDENADFGDLAKLPAVDVTVKFSTISKSGNKFKLAVEFTNSSASLAFGLNPKLLSFSTREPILPVFWQDNYFSLLPGEKRMIDMQADTSLITGEKLIFKLDGWNLKEAKEQELAVP